MSNFIGTFNNNNNASEIEIKSDGLIVTSVNNSSIYLSGVIYNLDCKPNEAASEILKNYLTGGIESFKKYDGEFTFIISSPDETVIFRDRHGAGIQIYYNKEYFSSFLKNFLSIKGYKPTPNKEALFTFLSIGYVPSPMSSLAGVNKIPAGTVLTVKQGEQKLEALFPWEDFHNSCSNPLKISVEDATAEYQRLHKQAILSRVTGKSKVGLLLSGGYDSGGNIACLRDVYSGDAFSYSIGFKDNPWTELPLAKILSETFDTKHHEYEIDGSEINELPDIVEFLGDPFQEGGLMVNYAAMKLIGADKPEVILGGDGNDQHFGTAGKELAMNYTFKQKGYAPFQKLYSKLDFFSFFDKDNIFFRTQFHNDKILNIQKSDNFGFKNHDLKKLLKSDLPYTSHKYLDVVPTTFKNFDDFYFVHNYFGDIKQVINEVILFKASKMATLFDNSLSFPYMSTDIYEFLKNLPRELKCKGSIEEMAKGKGVTKFLHKNYLESKLPSEITHRKKQGGFAPLPIFFKDDSQRKKLSEYIMSSDATKELFSEKALKHFFDAYDSNVIKGSYWFWYRQVKAFQFFNLLVICIWWDIFINNKKPEDLKSLIKQTT
jgi:asparagine synthase (glutamine-hydrolysing)